MECNVIGIDPGIKTGGMVARRWPGGEVVAAEGWNSWESQCEVAVALDQSGIPLDTPTLVFQAEGPFYKVGHDRKGRPCLLNAHGVEDVVQSLGLWRHVAHDLGALWAPPVQWVVWAGAITGLTGRRLTKLGVAASPVYAGRLRGWPAGIPVGSEHKRDAYWMAEWYYRERIGGMHHHAVNATVLRRRKITR